MDPYVYIKVNRGIFKEQFVDAMYSGAGTPMPTLHPNAKNAIS